MEINRIIQGNCIKALKSLPNESVDLIFADPPYNLQLKRELIRPDNSKVSAVNDDWDKFSSFKDYDIFTENWLTECRRVLKKNGTIWVIGSYHNVFRVGSILQNLGFWILNDIIWNKTNPMPNFKGTRFTNAHETLIWASKYESSKYTFNYHAMKSLNGDLQMRSDWRLPICSGKERLKIDGDKLHSTQKPETLLSRVIISSSNIGDLVLDPFLGSGTTAAIAKKYSRNWIGIEKEKSYINEAQKRIDNTEKVKINFLETIKSKKEEPKVAFGSLIEKGLLNPGETLFDGRQRWFAKVRIDGSLISNNSKGSIHSVGAEVQGLTACNGWTFWHTKLNGNIVPIDILRSMVRKNLNNKNNWV
ncbi:MAG: hypothetical protein CMP38_02760 [Rickettsiales bacterium]|nr:hypothetical protein [Rickettsiales bacterium]|tara:strand:+ start:1357 stop:2439 length:1083 start_codon:yes stop_codon:yes gene_type:complete